MSVIVLPKKSMVSGKVPAPNELEFGEICINYADRILYARHPESGEILKFPGCVIEQFQVTPDNKLITATISFDSAGHNHAE